MVQTMVCLSVIPQERANTLFQRSEDFGPQDAAKTERDLDSLIQEMQGLRITHDEIYHPVHREVTTTSAVSTKLDELNDKLSALYAKLSQKHIALQDAHSRIPSIQDCAKITASVDKWQRDFMEYKLLEERCTNLRTCVESLHFESAMKLLQTVTAKCAEIEAESKLDQQVLKIRNIWQQHWPNCQVSPDRSTQDLYVQYQVRLLECQALTRFRQSIQFVCSKIMGTDSRLNAVRELQGQVHTLLIQLQKDLTVLCNSFDETATAKDQTSVTNPLPPQQPSENSLTFSASEYAWFSYFRTIDKNTRTIEETLKSVCQQVGALSKKLSAELTTSLQTYEQAPTSLLDEYKARVLHLQETIRIALHGNELSNGLIATTPNVLTSPVLEYATTLQDALVELRQMLGRIRQIQIAHFDSIAKVACKKFFLSITTSTEISSNTLKLFGGALIRLFHLKDVKPSPGIVGECLQQGSSMLCQALASHESILQLTVDEEIVFQQVMAKKFFTEFSGSPIGDTQVPEILIRCMLKQILHSLFFQKNPVNIQIMLLINVLRSHPEYTDEWDKMKHDADFVAVLEVYFLKTQAFQLECSLLSDAGTIFGLLFSELLKKACAPTVYAHCWQLYFELIQKDTTHGDTFKTLKTFLHNTLVETGRRFGFHLLSPDVEKLPFPEVKTAHKSKDILLRALYAALWASHTDEKNAANRVVNECLQDPGLQDTIKTADRSLLELIYAKTIALIMNYRFDVVVPQELELLRQGPIKTFLDQNTLASQNIFFVLYYLLQHESAQGPEMRLTEKLFKDKEAIDAFIHTCTQFRTFGSAK